MSNDFSLMGYESIPVAEYLPILENIKHDLKFIYDIFINSTLSGTLCLDTLQTKSHLILVQSNDASVNTDTIDCTTLEAETQQQRQIETLHIIEGLISKNSEPTDSDSSLNVVDKLKNLIKSKESNGNCCISENSSLKDEIFQYKQQIKEKESIINEKNDEIDNCKEELKGKDGKIQNLKVQIQNQIDELVSKEEKLESNNKLLKSVKEELSAKEEQIEKLNENIKKLEAKQQPTEKKAEPLNPEMKKILEEKIQRITELEAKIDNLQSKETENSENITKIQELENKIRQMQMQNEITNDENYKELLDSLKSKRSELRERDKTITELESNISDLENLNRKLEREIRISKKKSEENSQELQECENQRDEMEKKFKRLQKEHKECKSKFQNDEDLQKYFDEIKDLKLSLKSRENSIKEKDKIIDECKQKSIDLQEKLKLKNNNFDEEIAKRNIEMEKHNTISETLKREMESLKSDNDKKQQAIVAMREKIKSKNDNMMDPVELKKMQHLNKAKEMEIEQLHSKIVNLNDAFESKCVEYELANKKINELQAEIVNMKKLNFGNPRKDNTPKSPENPFPTWWSKHMD